MAYTFVRELTGSGNASGASSISATVPAAGCALGHIIFVGVMVADSSTAPVITDARSNVWTQVGSTAVNASGRTSHTYLYKSVLTTALISGDLVTASITGGTTSGVAIVASEFGGSSGSTTVDQTNNAVGSGTSPSAGSVTTLHTNELLITLIGVRNLNNAVGFTAGSGWSGLTISGAGAGGPGNWNGAVLEYRIETSTGSFTGNATLTGSSISWGAIIGSVYENVTTSTDDHSELEVTD